MVASVANNYRRIIVKVLLVCFIAHQEICEYIRLMCKNTIHLPRCHALLFSVLIKMTST